MHRCTNCLMAETKPGIKLNENDICQACYHHNRQRKEVNYEKRFEMLEEIVAEHRRDDGHYDCIIPVSGGKDSHFLTYIIKERLGMNPLLVNVGDPFTKTEAGKKDLENITEAFDCDLVRYDMGRKTARTMVRTAFEEMGYPDWPVERAMQTLPIKEAIRRDISLVIYGENVSWEYGGTLYGFDDEESYQADQQIHNRVAKPVDEELWLDNGLSKKDLNQISYPSEDKLKETDIEPIFMSYFVSWDGYDNYQIAEKWGFRDLTHEWNREGYIENYDQIDSIGYHLNGWLKYPKFGFRRATEVVGYRRRSDHFDLSLEEGIKIIREHDHKLDKKVLDDFLNFTGYSNQEFWDIVDKWQNNSLFDEEFTRSGTDQRPNNDFENIDLAKL